MNFTLLTFLFTFCQLYQPWYFSLLCIQGWAQHAVGVTDWGSQPHNTETGLLLCHLDLHSRCLAGEKRSSLQFVSLPIFPLIFSPASWDTQKGFLVGGSRAGNDNYKTKCRLSAHISSGQDQQRTPKWFRVTWFGSIVYLIKKWPIQPHTCLFIFFFSFIFLFVAWLPAKASLNRPCVSYCGSRHLSIDSVSSCSVFFSFLFSFSFFFSSGVASRRSGVNFIGFLSLD